jgi:hypothetical protein
MHRLQPIHRKVSASLAYRLDRARAKVGAPNAAESEPPAKSFSTLRLLIFFAVLFIDRYFLNSSLAIS